MKVLIISMDSIGEGLAFALKCSQAGHAVRIWYGKGCHPQVGEGMGKVERVENWLSSAKWCDIIVPTGNHQFMPKFDMLRRAGVRVFGPSAKSAALEIQRVKGMKLLEDAGIEVPEYRQFSSLKDAEAHQRKTDERYVFKTLGDEDDKSLSYVAKTPADMVARLQRWQKLGMNPRGPVMLQKVIDGVELGVSRWMGHGGFIGKYNENFEHKKLLSGDCGPNCGESGTVQKYCNESKLGDQVLAPLEESLMEMDHLGDIDINCIIDEKGKPWPLEFTCRLGWPAFNIMLATHRGDPLEWMVDACDGFDSLDTSTAIACGIVLAQPDYPYSEATKAEVSNIPIYGVTDKNRKYIAPQSVKTQVLPQMQNDKIVESPMWATCGDYLAVVTGTGRSVVQSCERAYKVVKELSVPNLMYRDDVGEKLKEQLPKLHEHGIATEFSYDG